MKICPACREGNMNAQAACGHCGTSLGSTPSLGGQSLGGMLLAGTYELQEMLREGGMGVVYRAVHKRLGNLVAVKLLKPSHEPDASRTRRFEMEARAASQLHHPHILSVMDFGKTSGGLLYIVSEYIRGFTLAELIDQRGPMPVPRALRLFSQLLGAVEEAHSHRVLHRDLKPDNVMVTQLRAGEDFLKLLDFGIAKVLEPHKPRLTVEGQVFGTPEYMAPEQATGGEVTNRSDLYSCAVMLFEMLTGKPPFQGTSVVLTLAKHLHDPVPSLVRAASQPLPQPLDAVFLRAMAKNPADRFGSVDEFREALFGVFQEVELSPCNRCGRRKDSPLGFCSDSCARGIPIQDDVQAPDRPGTAAAWVVPAPARVDALPPAAAPRTATQPTALALYAVTQNVMPEESDPAAPAVAGPWKGRERITTETTTFMSGHHNVLEILGPGGAGKSTVLASVRKLADGRGMKVHAVEGDASLAKVPWRPVQHLVADVLALSTRPSPEELQARATERGLTAEEVLALGDLLGTPRPHPPDDSAVLFREMGSAAVRALLAIPRSSPPLCITVDNIEMFDGPSQQFFRALCNEVVGTEHKVALASESVFLNAKGNHAVVSLEPLSAAEVETLLRHDVPHVDAPALARQIMEQAEGNLLFIHHAMRLLAEGGTNVSGPLDELVVRRLERLPAEAQEVLHALCVLGWSAPAELVQKVVASGIQVENVTALLTERGWIQVDANQTLRFTHPALADMVHESLSPSVRQELHRRALAVLDATEVHPAVLARHAFEARLEMRSLELQERAGDLAVKAQDHQNAAMTHFRRALHVARWELLLAETEEPHLRLSLKHAEALRLAGHHMAAEVVLKAAEVACRGQPVMQTQVAMQLAKLERVRNQEEKALDLLRVARAQARRVGSPPLALEVELAIAELHSARQQWTEAIEDVEEGVRVITGGGTLADAHVPASFWRLLVLLATALRRNGDLVRASQVAQQALTQARQEGSMTGRAQTHLLLGRIHGANGQTAAAEEHLAACVECYRAMGDRRNTAAALLAAATRHPARHAVGIQQALFLSRQLRWEEGVAAAERLASHAAQPSAAHATA